MFLDDKPQGTPAVEPVKVGTLKLSTAIRIGAKIRHQCRGNYYVSGGSCALGAAKEAIGAKDDSALQEAMGISHKERTVLFGQIIDKNDGGWTRERIADWLESRGY